MRMPKEKVELRLKDLRERFLNETRTELCEFIGLCNSNNYLHF